MAYLALGHCTKLRVLKQQLDHALDLIAESLAEAWHFRFVTCCILENF
jgi:hypothetical protein